MPGLYNSNFSPARAAFPQIRPAPDVDSQYLSELLAEHHKLGPFILYPRILRVSGMMSNQGFGDTDRLQHRSPSPMASSNLMPKFHGPSTGGWNGLPQESSVGPPGMSMDWQGAPESPSSYPVKKVLRLEIPVDAYPNDVECLSVGKASIKDLEEEEKLRGRSGYEHLNEPLHILIEAANIVDLMLRQAQEIIEELLKPVESGDFIKRQQLHELALPNSSLEWRVGGSGSGLKRAEPGH